MPVAACESLESTGYEAEERSHVDSLVYQGTLNKTRQAQMELCQGLEPLCAPRNRSPGFTSVPELFPPTQGLMGYSRVASHGPPSGWTWPSWLLNPALVSTDWSAEHHLVFRAPGSTFQLAVHP